MKFSFQGDVASLQTGLAYLAPELNMELGAGGTPVTVTHGGDGLAIAPEGEGYHITYDMPSDFFRAVALLCGMLRENNTVEPLIEKRSFDSCGIMIDCSRNAVLTVETAKDILRKMARMGLNCAMLYTEETYELEEYPYFGYMRGAYTKAELRELDQYALALGIELIPCIQTLGHLKLFLHWGTSEGLRDTVNTLLADEEETYRLIETMFRTLRECFTTKKIHIGMDEAADIGTGEHLRRFGYEEPYDILNRHLTRVVSLAKQYSFEPMMWSDMFFRLGSRNHEYYDLDVDFPEGFSEKIPDKLSLVYWDYYNEDENLIRSMVKNHQKLGCDIIFAGGIWKWIGMGMHYNKTFSATEPALKICREEGVRDVFATMWGDDGAEVDIYTTLLGLQLYAEYNYAETVDMERLKKYFRLCTGLDMDLFMELQVDNFPNELSPEGYWFTTPTVSKQVLYQDPMCGLFDKNLENVDLKTFYREKLEKLNSFEVPEELELLMEYQRQLLQTLYLKCDIGKKIRAAYAAKDLAALQDCCGDIDVLTEEVNTLEECFSALWESHNKVFGLDRVQLRLGGVVARLRVAKRRITAFLSGDVDVLEELEAKLLPYDGKDGIIAVQRYNSISSASSYFDY